MFFQQLARFRYKEINEFSQFLNLLFIKLDQLRQTILFEFVFIYKDKIAKTMSQREKILLEWISHIISTPVKSITQLASGTILIKAMRQSRNFGEIVISQMEGWKGNYFNMKQIMKQLDAFYKNVIKASFPTSIDALNLVDMAKGQDKQGLLNMLILLFIACIESSQKEIFIEVILQLDEQKQAQLMNVIQQYKVNKIQQTQQNQSQKDKNRINQLCFYLQNLQAENETLNQTLMQQGEKQKRIQQINKKLQEQNKKLRKQLNEKIAMLRENQQQQSKADLVLQDTNNDIIQQLKASFLIEAEQYNNEIVMLREQIIILEQKLEESENKWKQMQKIYKQQESRNSRNQTHQNCISLAKYKENVSDMANKIKQLSKNQVNNKMQILKLKNQIQTLSKEKQKLELQKSDSTTFVDRKTAQNVKLDILRALKQSLKDKLEQTKNKRATYSNNRPNDSQNSQNKQKQLSLLLQSESQPQELSQEDIRQKKRSKK